MLGEIEAHALERLAPVGLTHDQKVTHLAHADQPFHGIVVHHMRPRSDSERGTLPIEGLDGNAGASL